MAFDFSAYLAAHNPLQTYEVTKLQGGFVNVLARATRTSSVDSLHPDVFNVASLILKHAPPYVAGRGPTVLMTQWRQTAEARALEMLKNVVIGAGGEADEVQVPLVLRHDPEEFVLVMSDLGQLPNLQEVFGELGGYTEFTGRWKAVLPQLTGSSIEMRYFSTVGERVGRFFARMHSPGTIKRIAEDSRFGLQYLSSPELQGFVDNVVEGTVEKLSQFPDLLPSDPEPLFRMLREDQMRLMMDEEKSMVLGDSWPAAVLLDLDMESADPKICIIDWEFAKIHRGLHGDVAQMTAYLEVFRIAAVHQGKSAHVLVIDALTENLLDSYVTESVKQLAPWTHAKYQDLRYAVMRSAFLAHAAEMVNNAFWKVWHCEAEACLAGNGTHANVQTKCALVRKIIARAITYIRLARTSRQEFLEYSNWLELNEESRRSEGRGLLGLVASHSPI